MIGIIIASITLVLGLGVWIGYSAAIMAGKIDDNDSDVMQGKK